MELRYHIVDIKDVITHWVKDYKLKGDESLFHNKYYYDPDKGKVILELCVETKDKQQA